MSDRVTLETPTISPSPAAVVSKAVVRAARLLGLTNATLAEVLGLSEATVSRLSAGAYTLDSSSKAYELAVLLVRLFRSLDAIVGGEQESMRGWMRSPNAALAGTPSETIRRIDGLVAAVAYVDGSRARV